MAGSEGKDPVVQRAVNQGPLLYEAPTRLFVLADIVLAGGLGVKAPNCNVLSLPANEDYPCPHCGKSWCVLIHPKFGHVGHDH